MTTDKNHLPIAFFDSGVGGISVLRQAVKLLPYEDFLFFGDSANAPYGTRPKQEILELTLGHAAAFHDRGIKALVIACNTATSAAINELRRIYTDIPVVGIEPALKPAALMSPHPTVLVMATPGTVNGNKFHDLLGHYSDKANVIPLGCPGLMEYVEKGDTDGPGVTAYLTALLTPHLEKTHVDAIVLGCTHYPFLKGAISYVMGPQVSLVSSDTETANDVYRVLVTRDLLRDSSEPATHRYEATGSSADDFIALANRLMGREISTVSLVQTGVIDLPSHQFEEHIHE